MAFHFFPLLTRRYHVQVEGVNFFITVFKFLVYGVDDFTEVTYCGPVSNARRYSKKCKLPHGIRTSEEAILRLEVAVLEHSGNDWTSYPFDGVCEHSVERNVLTCILQAFRTWLISRLGLFLRTHVV